MNQSIPAPVLQQYRELMLECQNLRAKIAEIDTDRTEHTLVEETLKPLDPGRRAYRLVGECLVERTVGEVLPSVIANRENMEKSLVSLRELLGKQQAQVVELKTKYNLQEGQR